MFALDVHMQKSMEKNHKIQVARQRTGGGAEMNKPRKSVFHFW